MSDLMLKYNLLDDLGKQEVQDFIDFLLSRRKAKTVDESSTKQNVEPEKEAPKEETFMEKYRKDLLKVSVWTEEEVAVFEEALNQK